jgi:ABC-2 type transport system permease protein
MSTGTSATAPRPLDVSGTGPVPMLRLAKVEIRKAIDTRAGFWFMIAILLLVVVVEVIYSFAADDDLKNLNEYLGIAGTVLGYFLPILVIMLVTSEASQRNGLVTFTLEPKRSRVVVAKLLAGLGLGVALIAVSVVLALLGVVLGMVTGGSPSWEIDSMILFNGFILANVIGILTGFAIGMLLMNTPAGIVGYFAYTFILPGAVAILASLSSWFSDAAPWIEFNTARQALFTGDGTPSGEEWAQIAVSGFIWLVIPLFLGIRRLLRIEFK